MIDLLSSVVASTISTTLLYPAQRIKIQMQLDKSHSGIINTLTKIYNKDGVYGLYNGLVSLIIGNGLSYGIYFLVYQKCKEQIFDNNNANNLKIILCSSTIAGVAATLVTNPFWVLQTREAYQNKSMFRSGLKMIKQQGITSLWKGIYTSLVLVSNPIIQFCIYQALKKLIPLLAKQNSPLYDLLIFLIGAISKIISTLITYPYTVVRTKQHVSKDNNPILSSAKLIYQQQKFKGFYKGIKPKLIQTVLNSALMLMIYQKIKRMAIQILKTK